MMHNVTSNGAEIPALGFGTFRMSEQEVADVLPEAIRAGFRHVDTAQIYQNEAAVGDAIRASGIARGEIFLTTKVWVTHFAEADFRASVEESLTRLKTDHVDLLLLHWPGGSDVPLEEQLASLNSVRYKGQARHIGISNYTSALMREAVNLSPAPLATNQVEYHPWLNQSAVMQAAADTGMSLTAYYAMADGKSATDPLLAEIGSTHDKSAAQVALRWLVQQEEVIALSKTARLERVQENLAIFDFTLSEEEMARIHALAHPQGRIVSPPGLAPDWDKVLI